MGVALVLFSSLPEVAWFLQYSHCCARVSRRGPVPPWVRCRGCGRQSRFPAAAAAAAGDCGMLLLPDCRLYDWPVECAAPYPKRVHPHLEADSSMVVVITTQCKQALLDSVGTILGASIRTLACMRMGVNVFGLVGNSCI
jgi:hypothetical protein